MKLSFRTTVLEDKPFLRRVFEDSRQHIFVHLPLPEDQKRQLIEQQFELRTTQYWARFPGSCEQIVCCDDTAVGFVWTAQTAEALRIVDFAILEPYRNRGVGQAVMEHVIHESGGQPISLSVEIFNPAVRLYQRLGFQVVSQADLQVEMLRRPF